MVLAMITALIPILGPLLDKLLSRLVPDPEARRAAIGEFYAMLQQSDLAQLQVNQTEAASGSKWTSGWRPAIGWVCALALFYQYIVVPLFVWVTTWYGVAVGSSVLATMPSPPTLDNMLWELMFGMLGMGALRSFEKLKGVAT